MLTKKTQRKLILILTILSIVSTLLFAALSFVPGTDAEIADFVESQPLLSRLSLVIANAATVIILPLSMSLTNFIVIKYINWYEVAFYSLLGNYLGYIYAFYLAKRFRRFFTNLFSSLQEFNNFQDRFNDKQRIGGLILLRISLQGISDYTSYFLGLTDIKWKPFLISMLIAELIIKIPRYYLVYLGYNVNPMYFSGVFALIVIGYLMYKRSSKKNQMRAKPTNEQC